MSRKKDYQAIGAMAAVCSAALVAAKVYSLVVRRRERLAKEERDRRTYDLVLHIEGDPSRRDWGLSMHQPQSLREEVTVAVFGDFNVGKTYLINRISGISLPSSETDHTEGISIKATKEGIRWVDTAGMGAPYCVRSQTAEERYGTEHLIGELAYRLSDAQILVVSHCTSRDQEFINALHNWQIHEARPGKNLLIVVHNYCRVVDPNLLRTAFVNDVVTRFCIEEIVLPRRDHAGPERRVWIDKSDAYPVYHVLLGREGTPAGERYNEATFSSIFSLCTARLGFSPGQNYLEVTLQTLNDDLLQKYFDTRVRLRLNEVRTKLVPEDDGYRTGYAFADNGGSYPSKPCPLGTAQAPVSLPHYGNAGAPSAPQVRDARAALLDIKKKLEADDALARSNPLTPLDFKF